MYPRQTPIWPTQAPQGPQVQQSSTYRADGIARTGDNPWAEKRR